ncbi:MAG TPA: hypothetical protein VLY04_20455 [Bryobacteraceae bacterium]|nr:hypothetical protein [Bryobacteraceae bacterium]
MPTIKLTDQFGLDVDVTTGILSSLTKYFSNLPNLSLTNFNLKSIADLTLDNPAVTSVQAGLNFSQPVDIGLGGVTLAVNAGICGELNICVPPASGCKLFDPDPFGADIQVDSTQRYVSIKFSANAGPAASASINTLSFGLTPGVTATIANYRLFDTRPAAPSILDAVEATLADFCIPGGADDLKGLAAGAVITLEGAGTVKFSANANLLTLANPLAIVTLPLPLPALDVSAGGSVTIGATCQVTWDYQLRICKLDGNRVSLGLYRKSGTELTVSAGVSEGVSASISGTELFSTILSTVSKSAAADTGGLKGLGLPDEQIDAIQGAVKAAAQRKLEIALLSTLTASKSQDAAFLFEFDLGALGPDGNNALVAALRGDLSNLTGGSLPAGVIAVRNISTDLAQTGLTWKVNLLGIFNYISTAELIRKGTVLFEPVTGDLVITDSETAKRVSASTVNFGADTDKLRNVLAENLLITAVYRGSQTLVAPPELTCSHSYFELHASTDRKAMQDELAAATSLGLLDAAGRDALLGGQNDFGRTMVYAETSYDGNLAPGLFLNGEDPKSVEELEDAGRAAIQMIVARGAQDAYRLRAATDDDLWARMHREGQTKFGPLFPDLTAQKVGVIVADYTVIVWWANAMNSCGQKIAAMRKLLAVDPNPESAAFVALREDLAVHLAKVTSETHDEFGRPWGLVVMDQVSGSRAAARVHIAGPRFTLARERGTSRSAAG